MKIDLLPTPNDALVRESTVSITLTGREWIEVISALARRPPLEQLRDGLLLTLPMDLVERVVPTVDSRKP